MLRWLGRLARLGRALLRRRRPPRGRPIVASNGLVVVTDDPVAAEVIARAFQSGKPVLAHVNDQGEVTYEEGD